MKKVLIFENKVVEVHNEDFEEFDVHSSLQWMLAPDEVETQFTLDENGVFHHWDQRTSEEKYSDNMERLRQKRNVLLKQTDWWVFSDSPEPTHEQLAYRQALRDLPANTTDPENPVWPTKP